MICRAEQAPASRLEANEEDRNLWCARFSSTPTWCCTRALHLAERYQLSLYDALICASAQEVETKVLFTEGVNPIRLPPYSPNLNAFAERWVGSIKIPLSP